MERNKRCSEILRSGLTVVFIGTIIFLSVSCGKSPDSGATLMSGQFRQSVIETGELHAVNASLLVMPRINYIYGSSFKIIGISEHGKTVHKGDSVVSLDPASIQKYIIDRSESLESELASANKLNAQVINNMQDLKAQLRNEQASFDIKKLELERSGFESAGRRRVIELEFRQAEIRLNKILRKLELRPKLDSLDLLIQRIRVVQKENDLKIAREALNMLVVTSPLEGIFVIEDNRRTGQTLKVGDELYLGSPLAKIPDIRTMKVKGFVSENDISKIKLGQKVIVRLDALPSVPFNGKISSITRVCIEREGKKVFLSEVLIEESDLRLKPGMTVSCEYITYEGTDELYVPTNCLLEENKHFYLFVKKRNKIVKTEVKTGPSNNLYTIVSCNLKPGQPLVLPENILTGKQNRYAD